MSIMSLVFNIFCPLLSQGEGHVRRVNVLEDLFLVSLVGLFVIIIFGHFL